MLATSAPAYPTRSLHLAIETNEELTSLLDRKRWILAGVGVPGVFLKGFEDAVRPYEVRWQE
jgi:hypothetical protein